MRLFVQCTIDSIKNITAAMKGGNVTIFVIEINKIVSGLTAVSRATKAH